MKCPVCKSKQIQKRREKINWFIQVIIPCVMFLVFGFFFLFAGILFPPLLLVGIVCLVAAFAGPFIEWSKSNIYLCFACGTEWRGGEGFRRLGETGMPSPRPAKAKKSMDQSRKREDKGKSIVKKAQTPITDTSQASNNYNNDDDDDE